MFFGSDDAVLGAMPDVDGYHDIDRNEGCETVPGLVVYRFDAPLYFPNAAYLQRRIGEILDGPDGDVRWVMLNVEAVTYSAEPTAVSTRGG